jgi:hypothetical protein
MQGDITTGEAKFPECHILPRVLKIGHSGKSIFPECCTRGGISLGEKFTRKSKKRGLYIYDLLFTRKNKKRKGRLPRVPRQGALGEELFK